MLAHAESAADHEAFTTGKPARVISDCSINDGAIYGGLVGSVVLLGGGLTMLLVGVQKVPVEQTSGVKVRPWLSASTAGLGLAASF